MTTEERPYKKNIESLYLTQKVDYGNSLPWKIVNLSLSNKSIV